MALVRFISKHVGFLKVAQLILAVAFMTACGTMDNSDLPSDAEHQELPDSAKISEINFADENLQACIEGYDVEYAFELQSLACNNMGISDLSGLEYFVSLTHLELDSNLIEDLRPLVNLSKIAELYLHNNRISNIDALANLTNLTILDLGSPVGNEDQANEISDISPLGNLNNITYLILSYNDVTEISSVASLSKIISINVIGNNITDVLPLKALNSLTSVYLSNNDIIDVEPLAGLSELLFLTLDNNSISNVCSLNTLVKLMAIYLQSNQITEGVDCLVTLENIISYSGYQIDFTGNYNIPCSQLTTLEGALPGKVVHPSSCM